MNLSDYTAIPSLLGYLYQVRYALYLLIEKRDLTSLLSIEKFDDIAFESCDKPIELIQTKHHINSKGSLSNSSKDLWQTIRIWCTAINDGAVELDKAQFTIITTSKASSDSIAHWLKPSSSGVRNVRKALEKLYSIAKNSENGDNKSAYDIFLSLPTEKCEQLINKVIVLDGSSDINDSLDLIKKELMYCVHQDFVDAFYERLESWWIQRVIKQLVTIELSPISQEELLNKINDLREQFHMDNLPIDFPSPLDIDIRDIPVEHRVFIEQLRLISVRDNRIKIAVSDYYRAFQQRSKWIRDDLIFIDELESYEDRLKEEWQRRFEIMVEDIDEDIQIYDDNFEQMKIKKGRELYNEFDKANNTINIRERCTDPYIMRGSIHIMANRLLVGWHYDFFERLKQLLCVESVV